MYKSSYQKWKKISFNKKENKCPTVALEFIQSPNPIHACKTQLVAVTQKEFRTIMDIQIDATTKKASVIQVDLTGPQYYCKHCGKYLSSTCYYLDNDIPGKKSRYSLSWADEMMRRIITTNHSIGEIAIGSGMDKSVISRELTQRTKLFTETIETYAPCSVLFFLPWYCKGTMRCLVGGILENELLLYDILPTYGISEIQNVLNRIQDKHLREIAIKEIPETSNIYDACMKRFPNVSIHPVLKEYEIADLCKIRRCSMMDFLREFFRIVKNLADRFGFAKARYLLLTYQGALFRDASMFPLSCCISAYARAPISIRHTFAMAIAYQPEAIWNNYAMRFEAFFGNDLECIIPYEKNLPSPYYYDTLPDGNENNNGNDPLV